MRVAVSELLHLQPRIAKWTNLTSMNWWSTNRSTKCLSASKTSKRRSDPSPIRWLACSFCISLRMRMGSMATSSRFFSVRPARQKSSITRPQSSTIIPTKSLSTQKAVTSSLSNQPYSVKPCNKSRIIVSLAEKSHWQPLRRRNALRKRQKCSKRPQSNSRWWRCSRLCRCKVRKAHRFSEQSQARTHRKEAWDSRPRSDQLMMPVSWSLETAASRKP